jgi:hypothetical protein
MLLLCLRNYAKYCACVLSWYVTVGIEEIRQKWRHFSEDSAFCLLNYLS